MLVLQPFFDITGYILPYRLEQISQKPSQLPNMTEKS